jgi:hypothetical protein
MRYLVVNLSTEETSFEHYAKPENVIRYGLRKDKYPAGQYDIHAWPERGSISAPVRAYKRA